MHTTWQWGPRRFDPGSSGILASGRLFKTRAFLWAILLFLIVLVFFFASVFGAHWLGLRGKLFYVPPIVLPVVACWMYAILVRRFERRKAFEIEVKPRSLRDTALGFIFGGVFITAMWLLLLAVGLDTTHRGVWTSWFDDMLFGSYISAVLEELAFRAVVLRILARMFGARTGVLLSALLFGLAHFAHGSWLGIVGIIVNAGVTMGLLYVITGQLWLSIGMHLGYDFIETSVLGVGNHHGFLLSTPNAGVAAWLTGGTFGPDAAIPGMIVGLVINIVLWRVAFGKAAWLYRRNSSESQLGNIQSRTKEW